MSINIPCTLNFNGQQFSATIVMDDETSFPAVLRHPAGTQAELQNALIDGEIGIAQSTPTTQPTHLIVKTPAGFKKAILVDL